MARVNIDKDAYDFGYRLQEQRKLNNYTQKELANKIGVSVKTLSCYENNSQRPSLDTIVKIARLLNTSLDYLMNLDNEPVIKISRLTPEQKNLFYEFLRIYHHD